MAGTMANTSVQPHYTYDAQGEMQRLSDEVGTSCEEITHVDEDCVNRELTIGKKLGSWGLFNNCLTFTDDVISRCSYASGNPLGPNDYGGARGG